MPADENEGVRQPVRIVLYGGLSGANLSRRVQIQQQLVLIVHAHKCNKRIKAARQLAEEYQCSMPLCKFMRGVLNHMALCHDDNCSTPQCASSKQVLKHWRTCVNNICPICAPLRKVPGKGPRPAQPNRSSNGCA